MTLKTKAQFKALGYVSITELAELAGRTVHGGFRDTAKLSGVREIPVTDDNGKTEFLYCAADANKLPPIKKRGSYKKKEEEEAPAPSPAPEMPTPFDDEKPTYEEEIKDKDASVKIGTIDRLDSKSYAVLTMMIEGERERINALIQRIIALEKAPAPTNGKQARLFPEDQRIIDALQERIVSVEQGEDGILDRIEKIEAAMKVLLDFRKEFYPAEQEGQHAV